MHIEKLMEYIFTLTAVGTTIDLLWFMLWLCNIRYNNINARNLKQNTRKKEK